ncbi:High-affnity carbon uptake protein Hat/HatR [Rhodopirellula islandica]|uniref:High-affnity carbon uptake protein Hat/HatR n=1 Tax=Rhodopirellula islandica TaxID=595434 RepID=A0A0J1B619_RHOIS|nr:c-type cytochrome domain-containing protein [Rhodopirellula islandica]KLU02048.1 High-affnity carbon uptake protein Hat/HatR [Rhodopirellula islandica]
MIRPATKSLLVVLALSFEWSVGLDSIVGTPNQVSADTLPIDDLPDGHEVLFSRDVAPVLKKNCVACHNTSDDEGGVNLESGEQIRTSELDDLVVPGNAAGSRLFLLASHADDPVMPPEDNDVSASILNPMELALLKRWIQSGAIVDQTTDVPAEQNWQPLPTELQTVYGSAMTADGRLSAVSFGNQIRVFGTKSSEPIETLAIVEGEEAKPAHDDFVQDLFFDPTGHQLISAGYRNVKIWERTPFEPATIPTINQDETLAIAMNANGTHLAALSRRGELSVAEVGSDRWLWMKSFDLPEDLKTDDPTQVRIMLDSDGHQAAMQWGNTIRIVRVDSKDVETLDAASAFTSMQWIEPDHLATATGKLPAPAVSASLSPNGTTLWISTDSGAIGQYNLADQSYVEVAKTDPVAAAQLADDNWQTLVAETLVAAQEKDVKQAEDDVAAEKKNLESIAKEIETKTKLRNEKQVSVEEAKQAAESAAEKLAEAKQVVATKENELAAAMKELNQAEKIKARGEARLTDLEAERKRHQQVLAKLKQDHESSKAKAAASQSRHDSSRATDATLAVMDSGSRILTHAANTDDASQNAWSLWSATGDWLAELPELPTDGQLIASGDRCVLIRGTNGETQAFVAPPRSWSLRQTIGASTGPSPFANRVLSIDVHPSGKLLATGGGDPSRAGELMLWKVSDGSLIREIPNPHGDTVLCVRFSPDGKILATGGADQMIKLWDIESGSLIKTLEGHTHHVTSIAWNLNGRQLATASADASVKIWNIETGQATRTITGFKTEVTKLVYVGRENRIGVASGDSHFRVYRTDNGSRETNAKVSGDYLYALDSNRDGSQFIVGGASGAATRIDKSGKQSMEYVSDDE